MSVRSTFIAGGFFMVELDVYSIFNTKSTAFSQKNATRIAVFGNDGCHISYKLLAVFKILFSSERRYCSCSVSTCRDLESVRICKINENFYKWQWSLTKTPSLADNETARSKRKIWRLAACNYRLIVSLVFSARILCSYILVDGQ